MNKKLVAVPIIVLAIVAASYFALKAQVTAAVNETIESLEFVDFKLENTSLIPLSATIVLIGTVENPSNFQMTISMDADLYLGDAYITTLTMQDENIRANGKSTIEMRVKLGSSEIETFVEKQYEGGEPKWNGTVKAKTTAYFIPITVEKQLEKTFLQ